MTVLAVAAPGFSAPSETFIRAHARLIAPGRTALVCQDPMGARDLSEHVLDHVGAPRPARSLPDRLLRGVAARGRRLFERGVTARDRNRIARFLAKENVEVGLVEYLVFAAAIAPAFHAAQVPFFAHAHGYDVAPRFTRGAWGSAYRRLFRLCQGVIAPSQSLAERVVRLGCPESKIHVIYNGIDPDHFRPNGAPPGRRVLAVGRFVPKKAPDLTIRSFARAAVDYPDATLEMIGDGPMLGECRALAGELGLGERVIFQGAQPHDAVWRAMSRANIFAQHSVTAPDGDMEGFGISLVEAMASCVPVVATRHNGFVETVAEGETGLLVEEHDVDGMAAALSTLFADAELRRRMGEAGRARVEAKFSERRQIEELRTLLGVSTPPAPAPSPMTAEP